MHFIAQSAPDIRHKVQKATAGPQTLMNDLFQLAYLVFNNGDMVEKTECTQRNMQETQMIAMALSAQRPPTRRLPSLGQSGPGGPRGPWYTYKASVASVDKRGAGGSTAVHVSFASSQALAEGTPQTPGSRGPSTVDGFAIRRLMGPKAKNGSA